MTKFSDAISPILRHTTTSICWMERFIRQDEKLKRQTIMPSHDGHGWSMGDANSNEYDEIPLHSPSTTLLSCVRPFFPKCDDRRSIRHFEILDITFQMGDRSYVIRAHSLRQACNKLLLAVHFRWICVG